MHVTLSTAGNGVQTTQVFDPESGLVQQIRAGTADSVANTSYQFDTAGRLYSRSDMLVGTGTTEISCYDKVNRLQKYSLNGTGCGDGDDKKTLTYDAIGNITKKSDVSTAGGYIYGTNITSGAGPHAVTSITSCNGCMNPAGLANPVFQYDADGNLICLRASGAACDAAHSARYLTWTSFNMVSTVTQSSHVLTLNYDSEHSRFKQVDVFASNNITTLYLNAMGEMEERVIVNGLLTWRDYILADGKIVAQRSYTPLGNPQTVMNYFVLDHLGSVSVITDDLGQVQQDGNGVVIGRLAYDAWGKRRNAADWSDIQDCTPPPAATNISRGYTGHEEMDTVCLVNANARIYDPTTGRFMSPDSFTQDQYALQTLNRYSYVGNNPLSFTDPTGHFFGIDDLIVFMALVAVLEPVMEQVPILGSIFTIAASIACGPAGAACAAAVSAEVTGLSGGSIGDVLKAAALTYAQAALMNGIGGTNWSLPTKAIANGLVGGLSSVASGGKFVSGFLSAGIGTLSGPMLGQVGLTGTGGLVATAVVGGVTSVLGGDKFQNGAVTAAFAYVAGGGMDMDAGEDVTGARGDSSASKTGQPLASGSGAIYPSVAQAAAAANAIANPVSIAENVEYSWGYYYDPRVGMYGYTDILPRGPEGGTYALSFPAGVASVGMGHTHGDYSYKPCDSCSPVRTSQARDADVPNGGYDSDHFSSIGLKSDMYFMQHFKWTYYTLGTPSGQIYQWTPNGGVDTLRVP